MVQAEPVTTGVAVGGGRGGAARGGVRDAGLDAEGLSRRRSRSGCDDVTLDEFPALSGAVGDDRLLRERIETACGSNARERCAASGAAAIMVAVEPARRVRPGFRRFAIAAFVVLVPIALHTAWDHYEARRLARVVSDIRARNEPVTSIQQIGARTDSQDNAARYYEAAAALVYLGDSYGPSGLFNRMDDAGDADRPRIVQEVRSLLERNREAETLLARATDLPFEGYGAGTAYSYRADRLSKLARLANLRTLERLDARDAEAAAQSIVQQLRINRPMTASGVTELSIIGMGWAATPALREIDRFLAAGPSDASLQRVQKAIRELDDDACWNARSCRSVHSCSAATGTIRGSGSRRSETCRTARSFT